MPREAADQYNRTKTYIPRFNQTYFYISDTLTCTGAIWQDNASDNLRYLAHNVFIRESECQQYIEDIMFQIDRDFVFTGRRIRDYA